MFENSIKVFNKILKNKNFTKFIAIFILLFLSFALTNPNNVFTQTIVYLISFKVLWLFAIIKALLIASVNLELGLLYIIAIVVISSIPLNKKEEFSNIPNLVDKDKILKYNKNFKEPKKLTEIEKKEKKRTIKPVLKEKEETKKKKRNDFAISEDLYNEKSEVKKKEKSDIDEVNLEEEDETIEQELKKRVTNDYRKLEEYDSSSSESSDSNSSESSTDSSDSEKELNEVSISKARNHMLTKLRTGLKKRYINS